MNLLVPHVFVADKLFSRHMINWAGSDLRWTFRFAGGIVGH